MNLRMRRCCFIILKNKKNNFRQLTIADVTSVGRRLMKVTGFRGIFVDSSWLAEDSPKPIKKYFFVGIGLKLSCFL
jgi:hypothetical protein